MGLMYGATLGVVVTSIGITRYTTGMILRGDQTLSFVYWVIFAVSRFKKLDPQSFLFNQTVKIGLLAGLLSGAMYTVYIVILNNYIDTELSSKIVQFNEQQLALGNSELSEEGCCRLIENYENEFCGAGINLHLDMYDFRCRLFICEHTSGKKIKFEILIPKKL